MARRGRPPKPRVVLGRSDDKGDDALVDSALVEVEVREIDEGKRQVSDQDLPRMWAEEVELEDIGASRGIPSIVGEGSRILEVGHRAVQCRAPFDPLRKMRQVRKSDVGTMPQVKVGMVGMDGDIVDQSRSLVPVKMSDQHGEWHDVVKKGSVRAVASSPDRITLHRRFEGLEQEGRADGCE
ncbi:hypothetical protein Dimus_037783 [Dionaea muscipula]